MKQLPTQMQRLWVSCRVGEKSECEAYTNMFLGFWKATNLGGGIFHIMREFEQIID